MATKLSLLLKNKADLIEGKVPSEQLPQGVGGGLSAYDLAVQEGFSGTLEEWLASLQGEDGAGTGTGNSYMPSGW